MNMLTTVVLVFATVMLALGLAAISAGLTSPFPAPAGSAPDQPAVVMANGGALAVGSHGASPERVQPPVLPVDREGQAASMPLPPMRASGPWKSPLYPQNGVTLWDRIRVSSPRDRRAFLLGTAFQNHAGAAGASPAPQNGVTVWDQIRASSRQDRRGFLLGTAIQLHAPEAAATPGPQRVYPSKEG